MDIKEPKKKKQLTKKEKVSLAKEGINLIKKLSKRLIEHTKRNKNTKHINYKIHYLLHDPFTFINAYTKISKNKGALTKGYKDENVMQLFGLVKAENIAKKIKMGTYKFSPVKRTWIPKPGKNKKRPIDIPKQSDRIVQEAVRSILEAIYEPVFEEFGNYTKNLSNNYGFRPKKSCWTAIDKLQKHSRMCNMIIEGDIVSAYNNVNHKLLLKILSKRIKDKKFILLVENMLKSGIMDDKRFEHSLNGTPQGGIVSPLLFNIYMFELDKFVYENFVIPILEENIKEKKKTSKSSDAASREYIKARYDSDQAIKKLQKQKERAKTHGDVTQTEIKDLKKDFKKKRKIKLSTPYSQIDKLKKGAVYVRYADDWVLAITCTKKEALDIKEKISEFLKNKLKMLLDTEKTKITRVSEGYKFLGFEIRMSIKNIKTTRVLMSTKNGYRRPLRRTTSRQLTIEPDSKRLLERLRLLSFCNKDYKPQGKPSWTVYDEYQIVEKYSQVMRGIFNYYVNCERLTKLYRISYILHYSCAKTLARRKKISMPKIFKKYTKSLIIKRTISTTKRERIRQIEFLDLTNLRKKYETRERPIYMAYNSDPFRIREHWRTKFKIYQECCICGSEENIALHHINSLRNLKNKNNDKHQVIRSQINRMQLPVCHSCHMDITHGRYNDPKTPVEFYNEFIAKL